jgi:hypothetical protein
LRGISTGSRTPPPKRRGGVGSRTASMPTKPSSRSKPTVTAI